MMGFWTDTRHAVRVLTRSPGFLVVAVLTLALGIGANAAIFSVVNAFLLRPFPYPHPEQLAFLSEHSDQVRDMSISYPDLQDWNRQNNVFQAIGAFQGANFNLSGIGEPERVAGFNVSAGFFPAFGVKPVLGRAFAAAEDRPGAGAVAVVSYSFWQRRFGGDPGLIGRSLELSGRAYTVIGILPRTFSFFEPVEVWVPLGLTAGTPGIQNRGNHPGIYAVARMKPGVTVPEARAEMQAIMARLASQYPGTNAGNTARVISLREALNQQLGGVRAALWVLLAAVGLVLLIACANVGNLLLARGAARERELAVRCALGAGRWRLMRQMLTESLVLALAGGAAGLGLGVLGTQALVRLIPQDFRDLVGIRVDPAVLAFLLGITVLTGMIFGSAPAVHAARTDVNESLKEGGRSATAGAGRTRYRKLLVVSEFTFGLVLAAGSALMIRSFYRLLAVNPGFRTSNILTARVSLPQQKYPKPEQVANFYRAVLAHIRELPGVAAAGAITPLPLTGEGWQSSFYVEGTPPPRPGEMPNSDMHMVTPGYFAAMGPALLRGRTFTEADDASAPAVALVSKSFADRYWPGRSPVGKRIRFGLAADSSAPWVTVVGEVADTKQYGLDKNSKTELYIPAAQRPEGYATLVVRGNGNSELLTAGVRQAVAAVDSQQPVFAVRTMESYRNESVTDRRLAAMLLGLFAGLALVLAAVGIYGVLAYSVSQRAHEIGVRLALGATRVEMFRMVVGAGMRLAVVGEGIGIVIGIGLMRLASSLMFGVKPEDPLMFTLAALVLAAVAVVACYLPARRAMSVDPATALRYE